MNLPKPFSKDASQCSLFHSQRIRNTIIMINTYASYSWTGPLNLSRPFTQNIIILGQESRHVNYFLPEWPLALIHWSAFSQLYLIFVVLIVLIILTSSVIQIIFAVTQRKINQVGIFNFNIVNRCWRTVFICNSIPSFRHKVCSRHQTIFHHSSKRILTKFRSLPPTFPQAIQKPKWITIQFHAIS